MTSIYEAMLVSKNKRKARKEGIKKVALAIIEAIVIIAVMTIIALILNGALVILNLT